MRFPGPGLSSRGRFTVSIVIVVLSVLALIGIQAKIHVGHYLELRRHELRRLVEVSVAGIRPTLNSYRAGQLGLSAARSQALSVIRNDSYHEGGHPNAFFVGSYELAPIAPARDLFGSGMQPVEAYRGHTPAVLQQMVQIARSEAGRGFVAYEVEIAGTPRRKIAYIQGVPELNIYVGTGLFTTDIFEAIAAVVLRSVLIGSGLVLLMLAALIATLRPLTQLSRTLSEVFTRIADDPNESLEAVYPVPRDWKEGRVIYEGLHRMLDSLRTARFRQEISEDRFRRLFSDSRDAIILTNGLKVLECNQRVERILGKGRDLLIGSDIRDLLIESPSIDEPRLNDLLERAVDGETMDATLEFLAGDCAGTCSVHMSIHPLYLDMEFGFQIVMHDITWIRQSERMLQNLNENLYRTLYSIGDGIIVTDANGSITRMNRVAEELTDWTQEAAIGRFLSEVVQLKDIHSGQPVESSLAEALQSGRNARNETRELVTRGGTRRSVAENGAPIRAADDSITGGVMVFRDVTQQLQMQRELRENQRILSLVLDHAPIGVGAFSRRGNFIYANPVLCEMLGYSAIELRNMRFNAMVHPQDLHDHSRDFRRLARGNEGGSFEIRYRHSSGSYRDAVLRGGGVESSRHARRPDFVVAIVQDVTEIKHAEQESQRKEQLLIQAEKLAALGELSAGMAHEINQPLTGISMAADNLLFLATGEIPGKELSGEYVQEKTEHIHDYVDRIRSIIEHVRTFSREQLEEYRQPFFPKDAVANALSLVTSQYRGYGIELLPQLESAPVVLGNLYRLEQVVLNLLTNARDAVDERRAKHEDAYRPQIQIITRSVSDTASGQEYAEIRIADNGVGISADAQQQLFNPFFTTKPVHLGTGLGLSVAYGIVQEMGGEIYFETELDEGAAAVIRLPGLED